MLNFVKTVEKAVGKVVEWWWKESGKSCEKEEYLLAFPRE